MNLFSFFKSKNRTTSVGAAIGPIGLHFARDILHMVQLEKHGGGLRLRSGLSVKYPDNRESLLASADDFRSFVKKALKTGHFKGNEVVTCLPGGVKIINLSYQIEPGQEVEDEIVKSITHSLGGAPEDYIIDYMPIRSESLTSSDKSILAMVASREKVLHFLDLLTGAGLQVKALDVGPASLGRLVSSKDFEKKFPHTLLINFAENKSYLTVFDGRRLIMDRELSLGLNKLLDVLAKSLAIDREQAMELLNRYGFQAKDEAVGSNGFSMDDREIVDSILEILKPYFYEVAEEVKKMLLFIKSETRGKTAVEHIYLLGCIA
ncbi:MAG: pilus assembly protein PilM, partial [Desulfobulbales bacterium]|nr:pilus assembly protein PilM [Desulfobulbales bacterium]